MTTYENHRGVEIGAERDEGGLHRPVVDGDYYGKRTYLGSRDALAAARRKVDRDQGVVHESTAMLPDDDDAPWVRERRDAIR